MLAGWVGGMTIGCVAGSADSGLTGAGAGAGAGVTTPSLAIKALEVSGALGVDSPQPESRLQAVAIDAAINRREYISSYSTGQLAYGYI